MRRVCLTLVVGALSLPGGLADAHPSVNERVQAANQKIAEDPQNAMLYLRRGELHVEDRHFHAAKSDFRRAERLDPELHEVDYVRGLMWIEAGSPKKAVRALDRFLEHDSSRSKAHFARAKALATLGKREEAVAGISAGLELTKRQDPEPYLERAKLLVELGRPRDAITSIEGAGPRTSRSIVLAEFVIEAEASLGEFKLALARLEKLPQNLQLSPRWLKRRGELLVADGRAGEAVAALVAAQATLLALPASRQQSPAMSKLAAELEAGLAALR